VRAGILPLLDKLVEPPMERLYKILISYCKNFRFSKLKLGEARRLVQNNVSKGVNFDTETESGFTTSSTKSYKYGVTMSDNDVPGIDLSKYMVQ
jgi:hypothetical protein